MTTGNPTSCDDCPAVRGEPCRLDCNSAILQRSIDDEYNTMSFDELNALWRKEAYTVADMLQQTPLMVAGSDLTIPPYNFHSEFKPTKAPHLFIVRDVQE